MGGGQPRYIMALAKDLSIQDVENDNDDVSITSSILEEEWDAEQDFDVDEILAEGIIEGQIKYLTQWTGYPLADAGWEPREHLMEETISDWKQQKRLQERGDKNEFNLTRWQEARLDKIHGKIARHDERNAKRRGLGLEPTELPDAYPRELEYMSQPLSNWIHSTEGSGLHGEDSDGSLGSLFVSDGGGEDIEVMESDENATVTEPTDTGVLLNSDPPKSVKPDSPLRKTSVAEDITSLPNSPTSHSPEQPKLPRMHTFPPVSAAQKSPPGPGKSSKAKLRGNVFIAGKIRKARRTLGQAATDGTTTPKRLNYRKQNLINKQLRDRENQAPAQMPRNLISLNHNVLAALPASQSNISIPVPQGAGHPPAEEAVDTPEGLGVSTQSNMGATPSKSIQDASGDYVPASSILRDTALDNRGLRKKKSVTWSETNDIREFESTTPETIPTNQPTINGEQSLYMPSTEDLDEDMDAETECIRFRTVTSVFKPPSPPRGAKQSLIKLCLLGPDARSKINLTFEWVQAGGLGPWYASFMREETLIFTHTCIGQDLTGRDQVLSSITQNVLIYGDVTSDPRDEDAVTNLVKKLQLNGAGILCHYELYCILIFPTKSEQWERLDTALSALCKNTQHQPLTCCIFRPWSGFSPSLLPSTTTSKEALVDTTVPDGLDLLLQLDCAKLLPYPCSRQDLNNLGECFFFLMFPQGGMVEAKGLAQWIFTSMAGVPNCKVFDSFVPGAWNKFCELTRKKGNAVVIIHEDAIGHLRLIPDMATIVKESSGTRAFWVFERSLETLRRYPVEDPMTSIGDLSFARVLHVGRVFLATPSFILSEPRKFHTFLKFFYKYCTNPMQPRLYGKLVLPTDYECFISELIGIHTLVAYQAPKKQLFSHKDSEASAKVWNYLTRIKTPYGKFPGDEFIIIAPEAIDPYDEQSLVNWFGWWSLQNLNQYACAYVIGSERSMDDPRMTAKITTPVWDDAAQEDPVLGSMAKHWLTSELDSNDEKSMAPPDLAVVRPGEATDKLKQLYTDLRGSYSGSPMMVLYVYPIAYWRPEMPSIMGDSRQDFHAYHDWFKIFHPFSLIQKRRSSNTLAGLFYTITTEWEPEKGVGKGTPRRPWLAFFRPVDVQSQHWTSAELLIWDTAYRGQLNGRQLYVSDLIPAQRELIKLVNDLNEEKNPGVHLKKVWLGGHQGDEGADLNLYHRTFSYLEYALNNFRLAMPSRSQQLLGSGWSVVEPGQRPEPDAMDVDENDNEARRAVFHPPGSYNYDGPSTTLNFFFKHSANARRRGERRTFKLTYSNTMSWYKKQQKEGRDFKHINVNSWPEIFSELGIPISEEEAGEQD